MNLSGKAVQIPEERVDSRFRHPVKRRAWYFRTEIHTPLAQISFDDWCKENLEDFEFIGISTVAVYEEADATLMKLTWC